MSTENSKQINAHRQRMSDGRTTSHLFIENDYLCVIQCQVSIYRESNNKDNKQGTFNKRFIKKNRDRENNEVHIQNQQLVTSGCLLNKYIQRQSAFWV